MNDEFNAWFQQFIYKLGKRFNSISMGLNWYLGHNGKIIIETGTSRLIGNWEGDGCFTVIAGSIAKATNTKLWTCDLLKDHIDAAKFMTREFKDNIEYVEGDSVAFLESVLCPIDFLYLDSMDFVIGGDPNPAQDHCLKEYLAAKENLHSNSIVIIDDCALPQGGKGKKCIEQMHSDGWVSIYSSYQEVLIKS